MSDSKWLILNESQNPFLSLGISAGESRAYQNQTGAHDRQIPPIR